MSSFLEEMSSGISSSYNSYSPPSQHTNAIFTSNYTQQLQDLLPHELKHHNQLDKEAKRYKEIDMNNYWPQPRDRCTIERLHQPSRERFIKDFVQRKKPVILTGLMDDWTAMKEWQFDKLGM